MLVILRMNRDFMRLMRMHHPEVAFQKFGQTVVEMDLPDLPGMSLYDKPYWDAVGHHNP